MANVPNKRMNSASSSRLFAKIPFANRVLSFPFDPCSLRSLLFPNRPESALPALLLGHGARSTPSSRLGIAESDAAALRTEFWQTVYADKDSAYAAVARELRLRLEHYEFRGGEVVDLVVRTRFRAVCIKSSASADIGDSPAKVIELPHSSGQKG